MSEKQVINLECLYSTINVVYEHDYRGPGVASTELSDGDEYSAPTIFF
jgi:hypothetical protein